MHSLKIGWLFQIGIYLGILTSVICNESILSNCILPTNSPQFAILCRLPNLTPLGDMICDYDCRCTHGANVRGGRCGIPVGRSSLFCVCDYNRESPRQPLLPNVPCVGEGEFLSQVYKLPILGTGILDPLISPVINNLCKEDCRCSHGYPDNVESEMATNNGDPENDITFCICGNAQTLAVQ